MITKYRDISDTLISVANTTSQKVLVDYLDSNNNSLIYVLFCLNRLFNDKFEYQNRISLQIIISLHFVHHLTRISKSIKD